MISRVGFAVAAAALLGILLMTPAPASAKFCSKNSECAPGYCEVTWDFLLFKLKECRLLCNVDTDCTSRLCRNGGCQACGSNSDCGGNRQCVGSQCVTPSASGSPTGIPGEGRKCMPLDGSKPPGWATDAKGKPLGACPKGTFCSDQGFCRKLEQ